MSRIGRIPIDVPAGVQVRLEGGVIKVKGPQGELEDILPAGIKTELQDGKLHLTADYSSSREIRALYGTARARAANMVLGVQSGFTKVLDIVGLGFKAQLAGEKLILNLGRSHPVAYQVPQGVKIAVDPKSTQITVSGPSKDRVGAAAAAIRALRVPEPYKGTGIRYRGEHIVRKAGKTAAGVGAGAGAGGAKK